MLAPRNAADSMESPLAPGAYAAGVVAARADTSSRVASAGRARTTGKSLPPRTAPAHRRRLAQPEAAVAPTILSGLTCARTSACASPATQQGPTGAARAGRGRAVRAHRPPAGSAPRRPGTAPGAPRPRRADRPTTA